MRQRSMFTLVVLGAALNLYAMSFRMPALLFRQGSTDGRVVHMVAEPVARSGAEMVTVGLFGPFLLNFAVLANPLLLAGGVLLVLHRTRGAVVCLVLAALLALQTFQLLSQSIPEDEGGVMHLYLLRPLAGWYCWFGAILLPLGLAVHQHLALEKKPQA